ncbi:hypothetical protein [Terasakiella pusilla]|uniref:hypothetical protein n=1 Tax=Terasakiella pusilla TaxID=64973 RepID=UPI003AA7CA1F
MDLVAAVKEFEKLREKLHEDFPDKKISEEHLDISIIPCDTSTTEEIWLNFWQKPIRSSKKIDYTNEYVAKHKDVFAGLWKEMTDENSPYKVDKVKRVFGKGSGSNPDNFVFVGKKSEKFAKDNSLSAYRLMAINNGGVRFNKRVKQYGKNPFPELSTKSNLEEYLFSKDFYATVMSLQKEMGPYWGGVTVCHLMTDCGIGIKPDIHAVTALKYLGVIPMRFPRSIQSIKTCVETVQNATLLCKQLYGKVTARNLRLVDLDLMHMGDKLELNKHVENGTRVF